MTAAPRPEVRVALPDGWEQDEGADGTVLTARPAGAGLGAPALSVVASTRVADRPEEHLLRALAELGTALSDMHVLDVEVGEDEVRVLVAHEVLGLDATTCQRHLLGPDRTVVIAAVTTSDLLWPAWRGELDRLLGSVQARW